MPDQAGRAYGPALSRLLAAVTPDATVCPPQRKGANGMAVHQSRARAETLAAHEMLAAHIPDPESQLCRVCLTVVPCSPANAAANRLVELGLPVLDPVLPAQRRDALRRWFAPHRRGRPRSAPLLTWVWRRRFGSVMG